MFNPERLVEKGCTEPANPGGSVEEDTCFMAVRTIPGAPQRCDLRPGNSMGPCSPGPYIDT